MVNYFPKYNDMDFDNTSIIEVEMGSINKDLAVTNETIELDFN
jgi:hypothetical protein